MTFSIYTMTFICLYAHNGKGSVPYRISLVTHHFTSRYTRAALLNLDPVLNYAEKVLTCPQIGIIHQSYIHGQRLVKCFKATYPQIGITFQRYVVMSQTKYLVTINTYVDTTRLGWVGEFECKFT